MQRIGFEPCLRKFRDKDWERNPMQPTVISLVKKGEINKVNAAFTDFST